MITQILTSRNWNWPIFYFWHFFFSSEIKVKPLRGSMCLLVETFLIHLFIKSCRPDCSLTFWDIVQSVLLKHVEVDVVNARPASSAVVWHFGPKSRQNPRHFFWAKTGDSESRFVTAWRRSRQDRVIKTKSNVISSTQDGLEMLILVGW